MSYVQFLDLLGFKSSQGSISPQQEVLFTTSTMSEERLEKGVLQDALTTDVKTEGEADHCLVSFTGPGDPSDPQNCSGKQNWSIVGMMSAMTLLVYTTASFFTWIDY